MNSTIQTPTTDLAISLDFYEKLQFKILSETNPAIVTDGQVLIEINPDKFARAGVKFYKTSWSEELKIIEKTSAVHTIKNGYLVGSPTGIWVYLIESTDNLAYSVSKTGFSLLGNFAGISLETTDIARSSEFWKILGFEQTMGGREQGWITLQNQDDFSISLMNPLTCPHQFFNPSLTYFNGKNNLSIIENIRKQRVPIVEEITHFNSENIVDNIIIRDPGGYGFFIFSD